MGATKVAVVPIEGKLVNSCKKYLSAKALVVVHVFLLKLKH